MSASIGISADHLREYVVRPALQRMGLWSKEAEELVLGTAAQESRCGTYLHQVGGGPALGAWQVEPATYADLWGNYLAYRHDLADRARALASLRSIRDGVAAPDVSELMGNLLYAAAICRLLYLRAPGAIPSDAEGQARYWKRHYNTERGAGTVDEYLANWRALVRQ